MESDQFRPCLNDFEARRSGRFFLSLAIGAVVMALISGVFAVFVIPGITPPQLLVRVISSPPPPESEPEISADLPRQVRPLPVPPVQRPAFTRPAMPTAPVLTSIPTMETDFLVSESANALEAIAQFQADEEQRQQELLEEQERQEKAAEAAALLAQQKAAEEKAERDRQEAARQLAARKADAKRAQERALAARANEARRATAQADAAKKAAAARAKQVASTPSVSRRTPPNYPTSARRKGQQGTTRIAATVTAAGKVSSPRVVASSGHRALDSSAITAVKKWRFTPAKNGLGQPIAYQMTIPVTFRLN